MAGSTAFASKPAPTFACIHTSKNVGEGLPPKALIDPGFSLPDPPPSRASPLPLLAAFTYQNVGGGLPPKRPDLAQPIPKLPRCHSRPALERAIETAGIGKPKQMADFGQ